MKLYGYQIKIKKYYVYYEIHWKIFKTSRPMKKKIIFKK